MKKFSPCDMIRAVKLTTLKAGRCCGTSTPFLVKCLLKKVASADAAFFVPKLLQEREQHQDGLNQAEREHQPLEFVHDITPSHARGKPTHRTCREKYITRS